MITEIISLFKDEILKGAGSQIDEFRQSIDDGLKKYVESCYDKISNVKTYLFSENAVKFEEIYVPLSLKFEKQKAVSLPNNMSSIFRINNCITILGHAGSGKTMLMKHSFLNILREDTYIPIIIELRKIDTSRMNLFEYVSSLVFKLNLDRNEPIFNRVMDSGKFVFFFDGFDEISSTNKEVRTAEIEEFVDRYNKNYYMLTSRPGAGAEGLSRFRSYHVCDMDDNQIKSFVEKQTKFMGEDGDLIAQKILSSIYGSNNAVIIEYLRNPLLLSMFILTFRYTPELPAKKSDFYFNVFDTLYCKHDTTSKSGGYLHERKCKKEKEHYFRILQSFSYNSYFESKFEFDNAYINKMFDVVKRKTSIGFDNDDMIYDLSVSIGIWVLDGVTYVFPHRSMQEYFAASLISQSEEQVKKVVYSQIVSKKYGHDGYNFWSLCKELDEFCFLKYFVLKNLSEFEKKLEKVRDDTDDVKECVMLNYLSMMNIYVGFSKAGTVNYIKHNANLYVSLLRYLKRDIDFADAIFSWSFNGLCNFKKDGTSLVFLDIKDSNLKAFLQSTSLKDLLYAKFEKLKRYKIDLERELEEKKEEEMRLLEL